MRSLSCVPSPSGAGRNLKVEGEHFIGRSPPLFLALKVQLVVLVSAFVMVSTGQLLVCCSSTHGAPRAQPFVKVGARTPVPSGFSATAFTYTTPRID